MSAPDHQTRIAYLHTVNGALWEIARSEVPLGKSIVSTLSTALAEGRPLCAREIANARGPIDDAYSFGLVWFQASSVVAIEAAQ